MKPYNNLLDKYFKGETTLEEEWKLKKQVKYTEENFPDKIMLSFFEKEGEIPEGLEEEIYENISEIIQKNQKRKYWIFNIIAFAALIVFIFSIYLSFRNERIKKMENDFAMMETALFKVSSSIQPDHQDEMLVLWVDENVEIIIK